MKEIKDKKPSGAKAALEKFRSLDKDGKDKLATKIVTGAVCALLAVFVIWQAVPHDGKPVPNHGPSQGASQPTNATQQPGGPVDVDPAPSQGSGNDPIWDRGDAGLETAQDPNAYGEDGGESYKLLDPDGTQICKFSVPVGWEAAGTPGSVLLRPEGTGNADGEEPAVFSWGRLPHIDEIRSAGYWDLAENEDMGSYEAYRMTAEDWYMTEAYDETEIPVMLVRKYVRYADDGDGAAESEFWYVVLDRASSRGSRFIGTIDSAALSSMSTGRHPDPKAIARAVFEPSSEADPPWSGAVQPETAPQENEVPEPEQSGGTETE